MIVTMDEKAWNQVALWNVRVLANQELDRYQKSLETNTVAKRSQTTERYSGLAGRFGYTRDHINGWSRDIRDYFDNMVEFYNKKKAEYCKNLEETYLMGK